MAKIGIHRDGKHRTRTDEQIALYVLAGLLAFATTSDTAVPWTGKLVIVFLSALYGAVRQ